jgi:FixJ family two-component response regulator
MGAVEHKPPATAARILVVDDEPAILDVIREILGAQAECNLTLARTLGEAREAMRHEPIDLLVTDVNLPDGDGLSLLEDLRKLHPSAGALVITGHATIDNAVSALRGGAIDFLPKPFSIDELAERVCIALSAQQARHRQDLRLRKLRHTVRRLGAARKTISRKVDLLCNDLITAYGELSRQVEGVRIQNSFRACVDRAANLEQLLCHSMDWLLRQLGFCNIGIWLISAEQELQLGAYMKYTIPAEQSLTESLQKNLLPQAARKGFIRLRGEELKKTLTAAEQKHLAGQDVVGINCTYLGEVLGVLCLFRDEKTPFSDDDLNAVRAICPIFALSLARAVRGDAPNHQTEEDPPAATDDGPVQEPNKKTRRDPADWWKRGEESPF